MTDLESNSHYHAGKRARSQGCPRTIDDGRLSGASREAFRAGWDWQDAYLSRPQESAEETARRRAEVAAGLREVVEWLTS